MKRFMLVFLACVVCLSVSVCVIFTLTGNRAAMEATSGGEYVKSQQLAAGDTAGKPSIPTYLYDFGDPMTYTLGTQTNIQAIEHSDDGYISFTATQNDPFLTIGDPAGEGKTLAYAAIGYRTSFTGTDRGGEFYAQSSAGAGWGDPRTHAEWKWENTSGEWAVQVVELVWANDDVTLSSMRFDPIAQDTPAVSNGEGIDISYIALFPTSAEAESFDLAAYKEYLATNTEPETTPEETKAPVDEGDLKPVEKQTAEADTYAGTLNYELKQFNVSISYDVNGQIMKYTVDNNVNYISGGFGGIDDLGRRVYTQYSTYTPNYTTGVKEIEVDTKTVGVYGDNGEHYVGLFYFLWHGEHGDQGIFDIQKIIDEYGEDAGKLSCGAWGPEGAMHFFAEPLYGYYYSSDEWVMRKNMELLSNANIDFLYFDVTNGYTYMNNALKLMKVCHELNEQGYDAPQVVFYTHTNAAGVVQELYRNIYSKELYPDTWFCLNDKPVIIAPESANIDGFFTMRQDQWPNEGTKQNAWPWMDWKWPQRVFKTNGEAESMSISIAQHSGNCVFSSSALYGYDGNRGRSYDGDNDALTDDSYKLGLNFQRQFNYALVKDVKVVLVTGWNEWVAQRQNPKTLGFEIGFVDTASLEYSRDAEMTRGGYFDNYYMQLLNNVDALKGAAPVIVQDARNPINVTDTFDQWNNVPVKYYDVEGDTAERKNGGFGHKTLTNDTGRNDITGMKVTSDTTYMYFYVECADTITDYKADSTWMNIYLNTDGEATGWYGYDYIINYAVTADGKSTVAKYSGVGGECSFAPVGNVNMRIAGDRLMVEVPMELIGVDCYDKIYVEFKCADSDTLIDEMEDFYLDGDAAPLGRLNYIYQNYIPGVSEIAGTAIVKVADKAAQIEEEKRVPETTDETTAETTEEAPVDTTAGTTEEAPVTTGEITTEATDVTTAAVTEKPEVTTAGTTAATTDGTTEEEKSGCFSAMGMGITAVITAMLAFGAVIRKKKD